MTLDYDSFERLSDRTELYYAEGPMQIDRIKALALGACSREEKAAAFEEVCEWLSAVGELLADLYAALVAEATARPDTG